jgi:hypothetical protein
MRPVAEPGAEGGCAALDGMKERRMPKDESTTPVMTLFAESAMASTCWLTRLRRPAWRASAGSRGVSEVIGLRVSGIGVRSAVLEGERRVSVKFVRQMEVKGFQDEPHDFVTVS